MRDRLVVILVLLPIGIGVALAGGIAFAAVVLLLLNLAAMEYSRLFSRPDMSVPAWLVCGGASALVVGRLLFGFDHIGAILTGILLVILVWFVFQFERGHAYAATAMGMTIGGIVYLGWMISYFVSLRQLPAGLWWMLIVVTCICGADSTAFLVGRRWGRHPLAPRLSPKKTREGYLGGILGGIAGGVLMGWLLGIPAGPLSGITPLAGLFLGIPISVIAPIGDLVISMMKREVHKKDTGTLLPGHGGALDRIDSWLVAAPLGYYLVLAFLALTQGVKIF
jgi:phosphatidate cytidylyltransferase